MSLPEVQMKDAPGSRGRAVVVGCGISGAAAANRLQRNGFDVTILEAESQVGGRTSTIHQDGFTIDLAASMLLKSYRRMVALIAEENWQAHFEPASDTIGVERDGCIHHIHAAKPLGAVSTGLLSARAKSRLGVIALDVFKHRKHLDWQNPVVAADLHYGDVREYADVRVGNAEVRDYLIDPACRFLGLSGLQDQSAVDFLFLARNMGKTEMFNSADGIDTLVRLLASDCKVETNALVTSVEESAHGVTVTWGRDGEQSRTVEADACVLAVPGPLATKIHPQMGAARADILNSVVYAPGLNVYLGTEVPTAEKSALILIPHLDYPDLACVILDHNKAKGRAPAGKGLISTFWHKDFALEHQHDSDEEILRAVMPSVGRLLPEAGGGLATVHVQRWDRALVIGPVSRYRDLERFKALTPPDSKVRMAGDSVSSSTMNSCLCSGERAADEVLAALGVPKRRAQV
ncbi:protoporphyrinogen/coproporphyrinogen oxidase [Mycolicibacterium hodleri]|uniref:FAD-dependent oxidoreductase n=1 Tax=Mycolicibacterium hodleri TaxID=49897 RepID=A0A502E3Y5_9MYCO|nr:NAD(P)/FAD-dependent oxidoreductase [Mycolicibacterium hodleri]TPG32448.1 FAD-dependent oxidoreductase [Mycolicibacterium hodleri]